MKKPRKKYYKRSEDFVPKIYEPADLAYMAGIVDGEGCFYIGLIPKKAGDGYINEHYRGLLKISNTCENLIDWLCKTFNGTNSATTRTTSSKKYTRDIYDWIATGDRLLDVCEQILPYLLLKKRHCEIMIQFRKTYTEQIGSHKVSEENLQIRNNCLGKIRKLNSRFHLHPLKHD